VKLAVCTDSLAVDTYISLQQSNNAAAQLF